MKNRYAAILTALIVLAGCASTPPGTPSAGVKNDQGSSGMLNADQIGLINANCYEVVIKKTGEDSLKYEKPLDWNLVDYATRNDEYLSLGTAFAIGPNEFATASHVMMLNNDSVVYRNRYIRSRSLEGGKVTTKVYEVADIKSYSSSRDFVIFSVKDLTAKTWFEIQESPAFNKRIYTAGNAFGEGIVVREGVLLGVLPEQENGDWNYLKSSIATNPGNSGGPLLNDELKVIGIVLQKKDDFCYSIGMKDILRGKAQVHLKTRFGFAAFNKKIMKTEDAEMPLPADYRTVIRWQSDFSQSYYVHGMDELLSSNADDFFPNGPNSAQALHSAVYSYFPQVFLQDSDNNQWFSTSLKPQASNLANNGQVAWAELYDKAGVWLLLLSHQSDVSASRLMDDPQYLGEYLLGGINITRKLTQNDPGNRVVSYGKPYETFSHTDAQGRPWKVNNWLLAFEDRMVITFSTPTPRGVVMLYVTTNSNEKKGMLYDLKRLTDLVNLSYLGDMTEWAAFLSRPDYVQGPLEKVSLDFKEGKYAKVRTGDYSLSFDQSMIPIVDKNELMISYDCFVKNGKPTWDIRRTRFDNGGEGDNYFSVACMPQPDPKLPKDVQNFWDSIIMKQGHPFTNQAYLEEGNSRIASIHPRFLDNGTVKPSGGYIYTCSIGKLGSSPADEMRTLMDKTFQNFIITK